MNIKKVNLCLPFSLNKEKPSAGLSRRNEVDMGSVDEYDIEDATTPIHRSEDWQNLSPEDRRRMAVSFFYAILGLCQKRSIRHCSESDAKFIAKVCRH